MNHRESDTAAIQPIVPGCYPDPTICRVGSDYYLAHSSFEYFPAAPIFHSRDLVNWKQIGNILTTRSQFRRGDAAPSGGIYGATLRHHDGRFWFVTTNVSDFAAGQLVVHAEDPAGPWSDPVFIPGARGIDPDLAWDDDGQCHLTWNALDFTTGGDGIRQAPVNLATGELTAPSYPVWQGIGLVAPEGPHLYRIGEYWYQFLAEGGTERGHCVTVARSRSLRGPYEPCPSNPILTHRSSSHPTQNVGHADLVQAPDNSWAAVYLGARPRGSTPAFHVLGRETFLAGVDWVDGWPVFDENRFTAAEVDTTFADTFDTDEFDIRWVVPGSEPEAIAEQHPSGGIAIRTQPDGTPGLLCARVRDLRWSAEARIAGAGELRLRIDERHWYGLIVHDGVVRARARIGDLESDLASVRVPTDSIGLRIESVDSSSLPVPHGTAGPDDVLLSYDDGDGFRQLARMDGRYLSTEVASGFTGRMLGLGPTGDNGRVLSVHYSPRPK